MPLLLLRLIAGLTSTNGTHGSGRAGQHFDLIKYSVEIKQLYHTHKHSLRVQYVKYYHKFDTDS